jgi:hypothetical protein
MATSIPKPALMNLHKADKLISFMLKSVADDDDDDELASEQRSLHTPDGLAEVCSLRVGASSSPSLQEWRCRFHFHVAQSA